MVSVADPKYANLPGIAYDQPDCYETNDLPESDQNDDYFEEENANIERLHLNATEAFSKFKGKSLSTKGVDFSDRLSRSRRTGYDARSGDWELVAEGEKETPMQKFQRIQCEIKELIEEVSLLKDTSRDEMANEKVPRDLIISQLDQAQKQLVELRLEETLGSELIRDLADPQGSQLKKLMSHLDALQSPGGKPAGSTAIKKEKADGKQEKSDLEPGTLRYQLNFRPEQARQQQTARLVELEAKVGKLETVVGASSGNLSRLASETDSVGLMSVAKRLQARINLLDPAQLDSADARLSAILSKMDNIAERSSGGADNVEQDKKVNELYEFVKKSENISGILPETLNRMGALESLHMQAADFSKSLTQLEAIQHQIAASLKNNEGLVKAVEKNLETNLEVMRKNMAALDARIAKLATPGKKK